MPPRELCALAGSHRCRVTVALRAPRAECASDEGRAARTGASTMTRRAIPNEEVARRGALIERSGVAEWLEAANRSPHRRPGRPRELSVAALLTALLLLATDDRALHRRRRPRCCLLDSPMRRRRRWASPVTSVTSVTCPFWRAIARCATSFARSPRCSTPRVLRRITD